MYGFVCVHGSGYGSSNATNDDEYGHGDGHMYNACPEYRHGYDYGYGYGCDYEAVRGQCEDYEIIFGNG